MFFLVGIVSFFIGVVVGGLLGSLQQQKMDGTDG